MKNNENTEKKPRNFKKFKYGSMSMVVIVLVVAIVVVINIIVGLLMKRYPIKADLTADKRYELCDETIGVLKSMDKDVEITVTYPKETLMQYSYFQMIPEILDKYSVYAQAGEGSIDVNYVDITKNPDVVSKYSKYYNGTISEGFIIIYADEKVKVTQIYNLFQQNSSSGYQTSSGSSVSFVGESTITSAIMSVTDANPINAAFATFMNSAYVYGEDSSLYYSTEQFKNLLASNGYECSDIDVMSDDISPDDYQLLVIPAPTSDFNEDVIAKLEDFLYNDGNYERHLIYISSLSAMELPNIEEFLAKWNLQIEDAVIMDDQNSINSYVGSLGGTAAAPIATIADTEAVGELPNESLPVVAPLSREVTILNKNTEYVMSAVLTSSSSSYLTALDETTEISDEKGARNIAAISKRERAEGLEVYTSSILAVGTAYMSDPTIAANTSAYNNSNLLLNIVNTMTGKENSFVIPQKNIQEQTLALTASQGRGIRNVVMYVIPLIVVASGVIVFIRRKNR